jgi:hypothetical protein
MFINEGQLKKYSRGRQKEESLGFVETKATKKIQLWGRSFL